MGRRQQGEDAMKKMGHYTIHEWCFKLEMEVKFLASVMERIPGWNEALEEELSHRKSIIENNKKK